MPTLGPRQRQQRPSLPPRDEPAAHDKKRNSDEVPGGEELVLGTRKSQQTLSAPERHGGETGASAGGKGCGRLVLPVLDRTRRENKRQRENAAGESARERENSGRRCSTAGGQEAARERCGTARERRQEAAGEHCNPNEGGDLQARDELGYSMNVIVECRTTT